MQRIEELLVAEHRTWRQTEEGCTGIGPDPLTGDEIPVPGADAGPRKSALQAHFWHGLNARGSFWSGTHILPQTDQIRRGRSVRLSPLGRHTFGRLMPERPG